MVEDDGLAGILTAQGTPERWVDKIVAEANRRGQARALKRALGEKRVLKDAPRQESQASIE